jgi:cell division protein FtsQ
MTDHLPGDTASAQPDVAGPAAPDTAEPPADHTEPVVFEGPRGRARRERVERRAAEKRARAIEEARQEAKRRAWRLPEAAAKPARGAVRGLKMLVWAVLLAVAAVALGLMLYFTPVMSVRNVDVEGIQAVSREEVLQAMGVRQGTPLLQVDTDVVADRVATIRRVASARVQRAYPSGLRVSIVERVPVAVKDFPDGSHLYDRDGVDFATAPPPPGLPYLDVDNPGPTDPPTKAALQVLIALAPDVASQVGRIEARSVASITLTLADGRVVVWGTTDRAGEKAQKLAALLTQPGRTFDVSSPDLPTVK